MVRGSVLAPAFAEDGSSSGICVAVAIAADVSATDVTLFCHGDFQTEWGFLATGHESLSRLGLCQFDTILLFLLGLTLLVPTNKQLAGPRLGDLFSDLGAVPLDSMASSGARHSVPSWHLGNV